MIKQPPLVLVEWMDSARPSPEWRFISDMPKPQPVRCRSVGWLVAEHNGVLELAPNLGDVDGEVSAQGCGFIRIPRISVTRMVLLAEGRKAR